MKKDKIDPKLRKALGIVGFPNGVLAASVSPQAIKAVKDCVSQDHPHHLFTTVEEFNKVLSPAILAPQLEAVFNEGIGLRELRQDMQTGDHVFVTLVDDQDQAGELAEELYQAGADTCRYFGSFKMERMHPESV